MKRMIFTIIFVLMTTFAYATSCKECHAGPAVNINEIAVVKANTFIKVREKSHNRSKEIDLMHDYHGLGYGAPWCQMFTNYSYHLAFKDYGLKSPFPKYARVCKFADWCVNRPLLVKTISTKKMVWGVDKVMLGDVLTFKHGLAGNYETYNWDGHAALVDSLPVKKNVLNTIEGNTKVGDAGDQTGKSKEPGDGVFKRQRPIGLATKFPIVQINRLQKRNIND